MIVVTPAVAGDAATLATVLQQYAEARPGGNGGAMLELRDERNLPVIAIVLDHAEMDELAARLGAHDSGQHHYLSTGCLHGDQVLPDGRTGHQYCQSDTGKNGAKRPAECKFCAAPCQCPCHQTTTTEQENQ